MDCPNPKRRSAAAGLPEDLLVEILARVSARSLYRSKCVAKAWRDLIEDPLHREKLHQTLQGFFFVDKRIRGQVIDFVSLPGKSVPLQIDTSLSFLTKLPGIDTLVFLDSCNGLLLFAHKKSWTLNLLGYVVCNPATEQWLVVPSRHDTPPSVHVVEPEKVRYTYLVFDPSVSSHFHLVEFGRDDSMAQRLHQQFCNDDEEMEVVPPTSEHVYSSVTGKWICMQSDHCEHDLEDWRHWGSQPCESSWSAVLNGMLHFVISDHFEYQNEIAAVDVEGATKKIIRLPAMSEKNPEKWRGEPGYVAQSQGRLHYINETSDAGLSIWVLEDYDAQAWVLKYSVSFKELFGKKSRTDRKNDYSVVAMHPDGNVVFIVQDWNLKLISYQLDCKLVSVIGTLEDDQIEDNQMDQLESVVGIFADNELFCDLLSGIRTSKYNTSTLHAVPYVPCFSGVTASLVLTNKN